MARIRPSPRLREGAVHALVLAAQGDAHAVGGTPFSPAMAFWMSAPIGAEVAAVDVALHVDDALDGVVVDSCPASVRGQRRDTVPKYAAAEGLAESVGACDDGLIEGLPGGA